MPSMKLLNKSLIFIVFCLIFSAPAFPQEENSDNFDPAEKARQAHEKASSDMMYQNEEWKAMYYQNQQIIQLLKEIRDSLDTLKTRVAVKDVEK
jgi:hypothetical protein